MFRRFPQIRQNDGSDCGAAALATVALYHRMPVGLERVRDLAGTDRVGTTLWGVAQAAERLGFSTKAVKGPFEALPQVPLPAIAHITNDDGDGHFVVLYRARTSGVTLADPARGIRKLSRNEFTQCWSGNLLLLTPELATGRKHCLRGSGESLASLRTAAGVSQGRLRRSLLLCPAHDIVGDHHLVLCAASSRCRPGSKRNTTAQRARLRHASDCVVPNAVRRAAAVPAGPCRPQGRSDADRRIRPSHHQPANAVLRDAAGGRDSLARQRRRQSPRCHQRNDVDAGCRRRVGLSLAARALDVRHAAGGRGDAVCAGHDWECGRAPRGSEATVSRGDGKRRAVLVSSRRRHLGC